MAMVIITVLIVMGLASFFDFLGDILHQVIGELHRNDTEAWWFNHRVAPHAADLVDAIDEQTVAKYNYEEFIVHAHDEVGKLASAFPQSALASNSRHEQDNLFSDMMERYGCVAASM